jgi:hypothetical protein
MNEKQFQKLIHNIQQSTRCHMCGQTYQPEDIRFLGQLDIMVFIRLTCRHCKAQALATISTDHNTAIYDSWDIESGNHSPEPVAQSAGSSVSFDDVLDVHKDLSDQQPISEWIKRLES